MFFTTTGKKKTTLAFKINWQLVFFGPSKRSSPSPWQGMPGALPLPPAPLQAPTSKRGRALSRSHLCCAGGQAGGGTWATMHTGSARDALLQCIRLQKQEPLQKPIEKPNMGGNACSWALTVILILCVLGIKHVGGKYTVWVLLWAGVLHWEELIDAIWFRKKPEYLLLSSYIICIDFIIFLLKHVKVEHVLCDVSAYTFMLLKDGFPL